MTCTEKCGSSLFPATISLSLAFTIGHGMLSTVITAIDNVMKATKTPPP